MTHNQLRQRANRAGYRLSKVRESSRDYEQYGPYMLIEPDTNGIVASGLDAHDVLAALEAVVG